MTHAFKLSKLSSRASSCALLGALVLLGFAAPAYADDMVKFKPYIGVDIQHTKYSYNNDYDIGGGLSLDGNKVLDDGLNGVNLHVGNRFNRYFGAELGLFYNPSAKKNIAAGDEVGNGTVALTDFNTKVKTHGLTLDALGYLPVDQAGSFELIGTTGVSWTKGETEIDGVKGDKSELGVRIGGGAQYNVTEDINLRGLIRYQTADFDDIADRAVVYSIGANYSF